MEESDGPLDLPKPNADYEISMFDKIRVMHDAKEIELFLKEFNTTTNGKRLNIENENVISEIITASFKKNSEFDSVVSILTVHSNLSG